MIEIRFFGKLRKQTKDQEIRETGLLRVPAGREETMASIFDRLNISTEDIYTIFLNSRLVAARSNMVKWLGYQQACTNPLAWDLNVKLMPGDRIGIFGRDMAALVV